MRDEDESSKNNGPIKTWIKSESSTHDTEHTRTKDFNGCTRNEHAPLFRCAFVRFFFFLFLAQVRPSDLLFFSLSIGTCVCAYRMNFSAIDSQHTHATSWGCFRFSMRRLLPLLLTKCVCLCSSFPSSSSSSPPAGVLNAASDHWPFVHEQM